MELIRNNVERLRFKGLHVFTFAVWGIHRRLTSVMAVGCFGCAALGGVPGQVVRLPWLLCTWKIWYPNELAWGTWCFDGKSTHLNWCIISNDPCVTWSNFVFKTSPYDSLAGCHQLMFLTGNPNRAEFYYGHMRVRCGGAACLPILWYWSREERWPK